MTLNIKDTNAQRHFTRFPDSQAMGIGAEAVLPLGSRVRLGLGLRLG